MDFRITSIETIKPSSPTPHHLRTYKLSLIDQLNPGAYFSVILFYSGGQLDTINKTSDHLKKSLSKTLTHFYPLAGQFKDNLFVDCNDHGVTFIEAHFAGDISEVIKQANIKILEQIIPCKPHEATRVDQNLMVKVNYFGCGGIAIGICFHHKLADGATTASFIKSWGMIARANDDDGGDDFKCVVYDSNSMFPAQDDLPNMALNIGLGLFSLDSLVKRFTFDGSKIKSLREKIVNENNIESFSDRPTRVEIVSSVILGALLAEAYTNVTAIIAVNLRKRMNPQLPEDSFGNITSAATLNLPTEEKNKVMNYGSLAKEIHRSIKMVDDQSVRKLYGEGEVLKLLKGDDAAAGGEGKIGKVFVISSWCKMPFYEADFGWGKAMSVGLGTRFIDAAVLIDSWDGEGIEAWVGLSKQDMARFEQHPGILAYSSY